MLPHKAKATEKSTLGFSFSSGYNQIPRKLYEGKLGQ
jgi:hypothetical protein